MMNPLRKGRFELSDESKNSWTMDPRLTEYSNQYMDKFVPNQTLIDNIVSGNPVLKWQNS